MGQLGEGESRNPIRIAQIAGLADYVSYKEIDSSKYVSFIRNGNYNSELGIDEDFGYLRIKQTEYNPGNGIDGIFEVNLGNSTFRIFMSGTKAYSLDLSTGNETLIGTLFSGPSIFQGTKFQNEFYFGNGIDNPKVYDGSTVRDLGAPKITDNGAGVLNGIYFYEIVFVTTAGDERQGAVSNIITLSNREAKVDLPIGYIGTLTRKLFRTAANGATPLLLATIPDNTTLTFIDNNLDSALGAPIGPINNPLPKVKYFTVSSSSRLFASGNMLRPTRTYFSDPNSGVLEPTNGYIDHSTISEDNSPVTSIKFTYGFLIIITGENIFRANVSVTPFTTIKTEANIGSKAPYTVVLMPRFQNFPGGVMFLATDGHFRVFNGNIAVPLATSVDNLRTDSFSQIITGTKGTAVFLDFANQDKFFAAFFNFAYQIAVRFKGFPKNDHILSYNIKTNGWAVRDTQDIKFLSILNGDLYSGRNNTSLIDKQYTGNSFDGQNINFRFDSGAFIASEALNHFRKMYHYINDTGDFPIKISVIYDDNELSPVEYNFNIKGTALLDFTFQVDTDGLDDSGTPDIYKINLNKAHKWMRFIVEKSGQENRMKWAGMTIYYDSLRTP